MILLRHKKRADFKREARRIFEERVEITRGLLSLPESAVDLVDGMVSWGVFDDYWSERVVERRSRRTQKHGT